jgi:UDP-N-acetylmuramate dehydrogenase
MLTIDTLALLKESLPELNILQNEPMSEHTSFRLGGVARYFVMPKNADEVVACLKILSQNGKKFVVIGNGSNLLVSDKGFDGVVICIGRSMSDIRVCKDTIFVEAGALLSRIASVAQKNALSGFEFASGIPGTLGGAVVMNAGAYGGEMKDVVQKTVYLSKDGTIKTLEGEMHGFGYRKSVFGEGDIVLSSEIKLKPGKAEDIKNYTRELNARRKEKQPLEYPSAGSTFKRPEGYFAAKLIEDAGLKGFSIGGAKVSEKHAGFVINYDNAKSSDVYELIREIQRIVWDKFKVALETEVRFIGEF